MTAPRRWIGSLLLGLPAPLRSLRNVPILGNLVHRLSHRILPSDEKVWARVERGPGQGLWLELNPRTGQQYLHGDVEPAIQEVLAEKLKPGMVFYDLGANIGFFSLLAARLVGATGKVISFEPDPEIVGRLRRNIAQNGFANVTVVQAGIWSASGNVNFVAADLSSPDRGVGKFVAGEDASAGTPTRCIALDDFVRGAPAPDAIKCDIEGAEVEAFRGAEKLIEAQHPLILCEMHSDANERFMRDYFVRFGYGLESVDALHVLAMPQPVGK
ncbi:MAG: FkbM family methyltransferase [Acidobacteriia bacterium]|nr:FkbM family methyltransferase [Terriglobia bacterium]